MVLSDSLRTPILIAYKHNFECWTPRNDIGKRRWLDSYKIWWTISFTLILIRLDVKPVLQYYRQWFLRIITKWWRSKVYTLQLIWKQENAKLFSFKSTSSLPHVCTKCLGGSPTKTYQSDTLLRCILDRVLRANVAELLTSSFQEAD